MSVAIVIPARFASTRLPAKPLLRETGHSLIEHVCMRANAVRGVDTVVVATDDDRIAAAVTSFGGRVAMTRPDHVSGTDRVAEVAATLPAEIIVNLQGDEPLFEPAAVEQLIDLMKQPGTDMATLAVRITDAEAYRNPNVVKVVCDDAGRALYFSRSPVPFIRDREPDFGTDVVLQHLGVYAYRREYLLHDHEAAATPARTGGEARTAPRPRQWRYLLRVGIGGDHAHRGVDTPEDYAAFVQQLWQTRRDAA